MAWPARPGARARPSRRRCRWIAAPAPSANWGNEMNSGCRAYAILTTCPPYGSRNVGDLLIEQRTRELVRNEKGPCDFLTVFREESLENRLEEINRCRAVLLPGFPVRDLPMFPGVYKLVENPDRIRPPLVPIGANWNRYPGDALSRTTI